jgi:hypothetical protein
MNVCVNEEVLKTKQCLFMPDGDGECVRDVCVLLETNPLDFTANDVDFDAEYAEINYKED